MVIRSAGYCQQDVKIFASSRGGGNLLYLPLDKLMQMTNPNTTPPAETPVAKPPEPAAAPEGGARGREAFRSREREGR